MCEPEVEPITPIIEPVTPQVYYGKGPYWDPESKGLYYVDVFQGTVHCYRPEGDIVHTASIGCGKLSYIMKFNILVIFFISTYVKQF